MCSHCPEALAPALQHQFILYASQLSCSGMFTPREQQQNPGCQEEMQRNTRLSNVILSCHSIREARNFNSVCCICCYGSTGASLTARRAACAHTYVTCGCIPDTTGSGHASTHVIGCNNPRDEVARHKKCKILRYCAAPQQLCETRRCCKCCKRAQSSELEHIIAVQGPQRQRKSSSADAPQCKDIEQRQCNLSSYCADPQLISSASCGGSSAAAQCEKPTCPATHTTQVSERAHPHLPQQKAHQHASRAR
jgi:hypothetical protein